MPYPGKDQLTRSDYNASFVGFAPANNPVLSMIVVIERPLNDDLRRRGLGADLPRSHVVRAAPLRHPLERDGAEAADWFRRQDLFGRDLMQLGDILDDSRSTSPRAVSRSRASRSTLDVADQVRCSSPCPARRPARGGVRQRGRRPRRALRGRRRSDRSRRAGRRRTGVAAAGATRARQCRPSSATPRRRPSWSGSPARTARRA